MNELNFFKNKKVLVTGHTGFKGTWLCKILLMLGAKVTGYALESLTKQNLFELCRLKEQMTSVYGDIRDLEHLKRVFEETEPEIVFHLAAQPLVRESYKNPVYTYETNVIGTVNVLECVRLTPSVKSFLNVTTDKVYQNNEWERGYQETDILNGYDPYSNSKSCSELVTESYKKSFFIDRHVAISTARAGNVIGGGDFAMDRIIPDCIRAVECGKNIVVRNPYSIRPYQHVLEPLFVYLMIAKRQLENSVYAGNYNIGPDDVNCLTTGDLVSLFCRKWEEKMNQKVEWIDQSDHGPYEAKFLKLDCTKLKETFDWNPQWNIDFVMEKIVEWTKVYFEGGDVEQCMEQQIHEFGLCLLAENLESYDIFL